jgi:hypothetical protein
MRKAVQATARLGKGRSSRNGKNDDRESAREGNGHGSNGHGSNGNGEREHSGMLPIGAPIKLRKTTPEEAALTAKNYRLAKELVCIIYYLLYREKIVYVCYICPSSHPLSLLSHLSLFFFFNRVNCAFDIEKSAKMSLVSPWKM